MITSNTPPRVRATLGTALATVIALSLATLNAAPAAAQNPAAVTPAETLNLSVGRGSMVRLNSPMTDLFVANEAVADVQVRSSTQLYLFGKGRGETTVYATDKSGRVVFSANVRVGQNISSVDDVLRLAMPDAAIEATPMNGIVLLTGTVASPADVEEAGRIVKAYVGEGTEVVSRLRTATPQQVNLRVKVVEINRTRLKQIGVNLLAGDRDGNFGISRSNRPSEIKNDIFGNPIGRGFELLADGVTSVLLNGNVLGLDIRSAIDLSEADGLVTTLAEPNLTALSGETASFLAGGEFPVPISQQFGTVSIEYKQYGVSLAFTPYVLGDGRISLNLWPHTFLASLAVELDERGLELRLDVFNRGAEEIEFTAALHSYFHVADVREAAVLGLKGISFHDKELDRDRAQDEDEITVRGPLDRVYRDAPDLLRIRDGAGGRMLVLEKGGFADAVVWNPWIEGAAKLDDMADDEYLQMLCVEAGSVAVPVRVEAGGRWSAWQRVSVESL
jgi:pilus assembly protein CpaC